MRKRVLRILGQVSAILAITLAADYILLATVFADWKRNWADAATAYTQASLKLSITFDEYVDVATFTAANLANLSIQDGTTTVTLSGASIITTQSSTIMEATLTVAEASALSSATVSVASIMV